jgi:hypothetical protein
MICVMLRVYKCVQYWTIQISSSWMLFPRSSLLSKVISLRSQFPLDCCIRWHPLCFLFSHQEDDSVSMPPTCVTVRYYTFFLYSTILTLSECLLSNFNVSSVVLTQPWFVQIWPTIKCNYSCFHYPCEWQFVFLYWCNESCLLLHFIVLFFIKFVLVLLLLTYNWCLLCSLTHYTYNMFFSW